MALLRPLLAKTFFFIGVVVGQRASARERERGKGDRREGERERDTLPGYSHFAPLAIQRVQMGPVYHRRGGGISFGARILSEGPLFGEGKAGVGREEREREKRTLRTFSFGFAAGGATSDCWMGWAVGVGSAFRSSELGSAGVVGSPNGASARNNHTSREAQEDELTLGRGHPLPRRPRVNVTVAHQLL